MKNIPFCLSLLILPFLVPYQLRADAAARLSTLPGFKVSVYASNLGHPRGMALSPKGHLYVCDIEEGRVLEILEGDEPGQSAGKKVVLDGLKRPHSLAFHEGYLYVGETDRVSRFEIADRTLSREEGKTIVSLPVRGNHYTRTILFGPDGELYISVGSSCNVCVEDDERRAAISRCGPDGSNFEVFAKGLRNAVGMVFRPGTSELWATCNGRDFLGDDLPPECVYRVEPGKHYGWPYSYSLHGKAVPDPDFGRYGVHQTGFPVFEYQAHAAPLGLTFYSGDQFPAKYQKGFFVCFHGSWNRSIPVGYKVVFVPLDPQGLAGQPVDFLWAFKHGADQVGRPVDVLTGPKGELFISDDYGGRIFRVTYEIPALKRKAKQR
ncbi:MAG TPA: PQQ-dependent sugar dehydrogenase [bacterium]|nr:PQQ-dependent sugar dehydrogenase [bacterium]